MTLWIAAVNLTTRLVILDDDRVFPIEVFFDCTGDETDDLNQATQAVAGADDTWFTFDPREWVGTLSVH